MAPLSPMQVGSLSHRARRSLVLHSPDPVVSLPIGGGGGAEAARPRKEAAFAGGREQVRD